MTNLRDMKRLSNGFDDHERHSELNSSYIARPLMDLLTRSVEEPELLHPWLPTGFTLLAAPPKTGKSLLAEQITRMVSLRLPCLHMALEYGEVVAKKRFEHFGPKNNVHIILRGQIGRLDQKGVSDLEQELDAIQPRLLVVDVVGLLKEPNQGGYDQEYRALERIKGLGEYAGCSVLGLHHTRKPSGNPDCDPFNQILGSTAYMDVPDNLMVMERSGEVTALHMRGRLIEDQTLHLEFCDAEYRETDRTGRENLTAASAQAAIYKALSAGPLTVSGLAQNLQRSEAQISRACSILAKRGDIVRVGPRGPYALPMR